MTTSSPQDASIAGHKRPTEALLENPSPIIAGLVVGLLIAYPASYFLQPGLLPLAMSMGGYILSFRQMVSNPQFASTVMFTVTCGAVVGGGVGLWISRRNSSSGGGILCGGRFWAVAMVITGAQTVWHIYRVWLMKFLQTGRGYDEHTALNFTSAYYIATDIGCFIAGFISLWLIRKGGSTPHNARRKVYAGACLLTSLSLLIPSLGKGWPLLGTLLLIGAGALALFPCYYSFVQELSSEHVGRLTGILSMWVWAVTSPLHSLFGMVADRTKSYDLGLLIAGLAPWLGVIAMIVLWKRDAPQAAGSH